MKMKKLGLLLMLLCVSFAVHAQELKKGDKLPDFQLKSSVYGNVSSADLKGKVVLVSLFATWCGPCQLELAEVQKTLWPKYKDNKDFVLLVIGREHTDEQLKVYNERKKFTFPLYPDPKREVFSLFAEKSIPRAYLFNKEGEAIYTSMGYEKEEFNHLMNAIEEALK
ncbi:TlpA disulfide reductase family protein [uncultured Phocaeicola sp.]|jgi:peroxiredoxin|uniref:TlpA family protein disulfide reductase n=1 Tax=uncultured Phocaeicola sp. TaxID=990718 RepID=UPI00258E42D4|nr:TlpA disulfide reductase family protein [uncultured Phocaeicola sp.]